MLIDDISRKNLKIAAEDYLQIREIYCSLVINIFLEEILP
ncbi:MAG: hypothetical protein BAJALOKI2v1_770008 [Promethearchaeota archaeon]|nr:MAG: hypothetical protein BAJALOKI2v1_770008 [Candidatus Lokiarchaeota archaeon]